MHNRLVGAFQRCLTVAHDSLSRLFTFEEDSFDELADCNFNSKSKLSNRLQIKPKASFADGILALRFANHQLPGKLLFMKDSTYCVMTVSVLFFRLHDGLKLRMPERKALRIEKSAPNLNGLEFLFEVPDGCLCIASIFLKYYKNESC